MKHKKRAVFYATVALSIFVVFLFSRAIGDYSQASLIEQNNDNIIEVTTKNEKISSREILITSELIIIMSLTMCITGLSVKRLSA